MLYDDRTARSGSCPSLEEVIPGVETILPAGARFYRIERPVAEAAPWAGSLAQDLRAVLNTQKLAHLPAPQGEEAPLRPEEILFLDLETTGLSMTPLFLVGTLAYKGENLVLQQFLARNFGEEAGVLMGLREIMKPIRLLVTFNGKTFDVPYVRARAAATRVSFDGAEAHSHLDMLYKARQLYRGKLPNCQLQTLEYYVCGRRRQGDIPGYEIPRVYHEYLRTGDPSRLALVLHHNLLDLVTLAELVTRLMPGR